MSETDVHSHTLVYLRQMDRRLQQLSDLVLRQQELIGRLERDTREGFAVVQRDVRELKSDLVLMENRVISAVTKDHEIEARLNETQERLAALEATPRGL